ncbi:MAG: hypothetical protein K9I82_11110 [Chitinophagaceae bacterium]|nr:hypothetical protein [Chitinophagaceae bacterium]
MQPIIFNSIAIISFLILLKLLNVVLKLKKSIPKVEKAMEQVPEPESPETSIFFKQVASYLNELAVPYFVDQKGNQITIEYPKKIGCPQIFINMVPEDSLPVYRLLMLKDFPDERLYKLTELIVRLNSKFKESKFNMLMESRLILFDILMPTSDGIVDKELHNEMLEHMLSVYDNFLPCFYKVAFEGEEPISVMLNNQD